MGFEFLRRPPTLIEGKAVALRGPSSSDRAFRPSPPQPLDEEKPTHRRADSSDTP